MDLYGDLDKYTNVPAAGGAGLGFSTVPVKEPVKPTKPAAVTPTSKSEAAPPAKSSTGTTSALKFIPRRRREEPVPRPSPVATGSVDVAPSAATRFSPANAATSLKTSLGMAAFTPVSVTRTKLSTETPPPHHSDDSPFDNRATELHRPDSVQEEYDPCRPNDYAAFCEEREIREKNAEVRADLERREKRLERERLREREQLEKDLEAGRVPNLATTTVPGGRGRGMNLPAWMMKKIEGNADDSAASATPTRPPPSPASTSQRGQFDDASPGTRSHDRSQVAPSSGGASRGPSPHHAPPPPPRQAPVEVVKKARLSRFGQRSDVESAAPTKQSVLLLLNMVAPGDVDDDLKDEVKEECEGKYGPVVECVVFEVPFRVPAEEAVRIFVEFVHEADAAKAMAGLNGRFFGGRKLTVTKFDKAQFDRRDLAP